MLFKRIIKGKSMLNADINPKVPEKCSRRKSECEGCGEHSTILEETMKMVMLGVVLWAGITFGSQVAPYPLNLIFSSENLHPRPVYDFPFPSPQMLKKLPPVTGVHTNRSIAFSQQSISMLERLEQNLDSAGIKPKTGSSAQGLLILGYPSEDAMHYEKSSMTITKASQNLVVTRCTRYGLPADECASFISTLNLRESAYGSECAALERFSCRTTKLNSKYRTFDGSCNNPVRSSWGHVFTGYKRLLHPKYADGIEEPRRALSHHPLPSARALSTKLADNLDKPDDSRTIALAVWSQFIYHDLVHTPVRKTIHTNQAIRCCDNSGFNLAPRYVHPSCLKIDVPHDDPYFKDKSVTCMEYTRSVTTYRGDCTFGASEQMNQATHFLDGSHIYGTSGRDADALRERFGGLLRSSILDGEELLPRADNPMEMCLLESEDSGCFTAGDVRANMHPWLTSLHTLWLREHNRIARQLATLNPGWNSDKLYHEARRIVVAMVQHVTYRQWLPAVTGKSYDDLYDHSDMSYNPDIDPTVTNSFATAAFHFVNTLLDKDIVLYDGKDNLYEDKENLYEDKRNNASFRLADSYFRPSLVVDGKVKEVLRGMVMQKSQRMDLNYDDDIRHKYMGNIDALALDIQRGRDHGLPSYLQYRQLCTATTFQENCFNTLKEFIPEQVVDKLEKIYEQPQDVDLLVGVMAETPLPNSLFGPTLTCLIKEQLWRTRVGDRYFYTHADESGSFTKRQLNEIRKSSIAGLLCENAGFTQVQKDVFKPVSESNPLLQCSEIKRLNLEPWRETTNQPNILTRTNKWLKEKVVSGPAYNIKQ